MGLVTESSTPLVFEENERWSVRARQVDARAITRPDVVPALRGSCSYPRYVDRAEGPYIWDVDGNRYIDYLLGYGPVILGHAHPIVTHAVVEELARGHCIAPLWSPRQVELTELLAQLVPGAENSLLLKTGSDATSAAVRLARLYTGRDTVLRCGYNGWHDWSVHQSAGVPKAVRGNSASFDYLDLSGLEAKLEASDCACVLMVPFEDDEAPPGHISKIRQLASRYGALLVLDEMRSGFRIALGGAQQFLGVQADLATFSKAMANGYAISALTGRAEVLSGLAQTKISSTFFANPADMVAALTTISLLRDTDALERVWSMGSLLQKGLRSLVAECRLPAVVVGYPPMPFMRFEFVDPDIQARVTKAFFATTTKLGVLMHPDHQWFVSAAHAEADIQATLAACRTGFTAAANAVE